MVIYSKVDIIKLCTWTAWWSQDVAWGEKVRKRGERVYIVSFVAWSTRARSRIGFEERSWQNLAGFVGLGRIWQNAADCHQIAVDCRQIAVSRSVSSCCVGGNRWTCVRCHGGVPWQQGCLYKATGLSKSDSAPIHGDGYEPGLQSSDLEPTQRRRTACRQDLVVVIGVKGGGENFLDSKILKTTTVGPLQYDNYYTVLSRAPIQSNVDKQFLITSPKTPMESIDDLISTNR